MRWVGHIDGIGAINNACSVVLILMKGALRKKLLGTQHVGEDNIKLDLRHGARMCEVD